MVDMEVLKEYIEKRIQGIKDELRVAERIVDKENHVLIIRGVIELEKELDLLENVLDGI
jgi:hypothetical protein